MLIISLSHRKSLFNSYHGPLACGGLWGGGGERIHFPEPPTFSESPTTQNLFDNPDAADSLARNGGGTLLIRSPMGQKKWPYLRGG